MEIQKTSNSQRNLEKEKWSWREEQNFQLGDFNVT